MIKRAAIQIPVEVPGSTPAASNTVRPSQPSPVRPKKATGPETQTAKAATTAAALLMIAQDIRASALLNSPTPLILRSGRKKGAIKKKVVMPMSILKMSPWRGGRFAASLKIGRGGRGGGKKVKGDGGQNAGETKAIKKRIIVHDTITIGDLAHRMGIKVSELIAKLMRLGVMATVNQSLDLETATLVASDFGYEVELAMTDEISIINLEEEASGGEMVVPSPCGHGHGPC